MEGRIDTYPFEMSIAAAPVEAPLRADAAVEDKMKSAPTLPLVHRFDPLTDSRWDSFLQKHPRASLFHSSPWLRALNLTYGYAVNGYTTSPPERELENGLVACRVESWLTGRRLVSLPFSDHCEPLVDRAEDVASIIARLEEETREEQWRYVELRSFNPTPIPCSVCMTSTQYCFHEIDLRPTIQEIFANFHKDSIQRKIRRAEREKLGYEEGSSDKLLAEFYDLLTTTRRRHHVPPQSKAWFQNLRSCFQDAFKIRIARRENKPLAAMLTLKHKDTMVYKYGGSDAANNNLGPMHLVYWKAIQDAKASGLKFFDLGRTDAGQAGLITFKNRWGANQYSLTYSRFALLEYPAHLFEQSPSKVGAITARKVIALLPNRFLSLIGRALYKHIG
jgi:CelD/BcsL family acetyltransferase involved in cellulose biosynthesis